MAAKNRLWGAERIRGELLKLDIQVCKRTIQKYIRRVRTPQPRGQRWATFLHNHAAAIWSCGFLQVSELFFRSLAGVLQHPRSRHDGCSMSASQGLPPIPGWRVPLREATPYGQAPRYLMCDNDRKFGPCFARVAATSALEILNTPYHAPRSNAICERFPTCSSSTKGNSTGCWAPMCSTSIEPDHIEGSGNRFQNRMVDLFH